MASHASASVDIFTVLLPHCRRHMTQLMSGYASGKGRRASKLLSTQHPIPDRYGLWCDMGWNFEKRMEGLEPNDLSEVGCWLEKCQSPAEQAMLLALLGDDGCGFRLGVPSFWMGCAAKLRIKHAFASSLAGVLLTLQVPIGPYRLDFAIVDLRPNPVHCLGIEVDGHDFHERTKEQIKRDKHRDRWMKGAGLEVLRFSGSEIYNSPADCMFDIYNVIHSQAIRGRSNPWPALNAAGCPMVKWSA